MLYSYKMELKICSIFFFLDALKQNENLRNFKVTSVSAFLSFVFMGLRCHRSTIDFIFRFYDFFPNGQLQISGLSLRSILFLLSMHPKTLDIASFLSSRFLSRRQSDFSDIQDDIQQKCHPGVIFLPTPSFSCTPFLFSTSVSFAFLNKNVNSVWTLKIK